MIRKIDTNWKICDAFIWRGEYLHPIRDFNTFDMDKLIGIDEQKELLLKNTESFINNKGGLNVLLYGPRGCGKSTLVRAVFTKYLQTNLKIVQISTQDVSIIPIFVDAMRIQPYKFIIFCDDLSFESDDNSYKALKVILDGSIERIPDNVLLYATSNRKHLMQEFQSDNTNTQIINNEIHFQDAVEERISLSDRFSLNIPFYKSSVEEYLKIVSLYFNDELSNELKTKALSYATQRGSKSGRVAQDFYRAIKVGLIRI
ncbi:ATP-binding protein [Helicobacter sp. MIT 14-3879]|uniref:ATP-binding protein n=1 Tax=Helicobacter sp. MIT 14-3879 TaxID=2040649 RepID=UPI000E1EE129|nr:ATP-binding protein [Helicobacter sp. MIT 14-3879]RDU65513.1 ATP-binding protein [Helicobacter sp. MIT 14-3879]